jgi:hypothetical protein
LTSVSLLTYKARPGRRSPATGSSPIEKESVMSSPGASASRSDATQRVCDADRVHRPRRSCSAPVHARRERPDPHRCTAIDRYSDWRDRPREIITLLGAGGSVLVVDRDAITLGDRRLLAHLGADEPPENATIVSRCFARRARRGRCSCRPLSAADLRAIPLVEESYDAEARTERGAPETLHDQCGRRYRIEPVAGANATPQLRWCRRGPGSREAPEPVSVRETIASLQRYEPVLTPTRRALALHHENGEVSLSLLRAELVRMQESPIVLNWALRAAVLDAVERRGQSMSEIAMRCGRIKRDSSGNASGETSWLARRLGLLPEGGRPEPTPWVHSDVLALIARDGLGLSPREVEAD